MLRVHRAAAYVHRRAKNRFHSQQLQCRACTNNVADGIDGADFVEMYFLDRYVVNLRLGRTQLLEHSRGISPGALRQSRLLDDLDDMPQMTVRLRFARIDVK